MRIQRQQGNSNIRGLVLIADNKHSLRRSMKMVLEASGWQVALAASGKEAIEFLAGIIPDLLIIEHELSGLSGCEVIRRLRNKQTLPKIVLVAERLHVANLARLIGVSNYIGKPLVPSEMTSMLGRFRFQ